MDKSGSDGSVGSGGDLYNRLVQMVSTFHF